MSRRTAVVTGTDFPDLTAGGRALAAALRDRGHEVDAAIWSDDGVDWRRFDAAVVRSCFGYYRDPAAFREWLSTVENAGVTVHNPPEVIRWNLHKSYLTDLADRGVTTVETEVVAPDETRELASILDERGWSEAVVKPAVGTSAAGVWRTTPETAAAEQEHFERRFSAARRVGGGTDSEGNGDDDRLPDTGTLVQAYRPEVADGERSLVFVAGSFAHAWNSLRAPDALGVEATVDGNDEGYEPPAPVLDDARAALDAAADAIGVDRTALTYARVDGVPIREGGDPVGLRLLELELIEPTLHLDAEPAAASALADAVDDGILSCES